MLKTEIRAQLLNAAIHEDRQEIRTIKDRIYQIATLVTVSSFAVTAFVLGRQDMPHRNVFLFITDFAFLVFLWASFLLLKRDLNTARSCLEIREQMIPELGKDDDAPFQPYVEVPPEMKPQFGEKALYWVLALVT